MRSALAFAGALAISLGGVVLGFWWLTFPAGLFAGLIATRARLAIPLGAVAGIVAWAIPLAVIQWTYGLGPSASSLAAIMGFGRQGAIPVVLTILVGLLLATTGAWLASAVLGIWRRPSPVAR
jgi:hypothetical protein